MRLHTLLRAVGPAARPVDDSTPPRPRHARYFGPQRPYLPPLVPFLVDEVRWVGSWVLQMELGQYRVEISSGVERRTVDLG